MADQFAFTLFYVERPDDPYYYTRWDLAKKIEVVAETQQQAINKATAALGPTPHYAHYWTFRVKKIRDMRIPVEAKEGSE